METVQFELELNQLQRRLGRERKARLDAEAIAETTTGVLYRKQQELELIQAVAVAANETTSVEEILQLALDRVCAYNGWPVGHAYLVGQEDPDELLPTKVWHLTSPKRFEIFRQVTEATRLSRGVGLPGRVMLSGKTEWSADVNKDANFPRAKTGKNLGVKGGFAFPVRAGTEVVGVLEFFTTEVAELDESLSDAMAHIGSLVGRVFERKRAQHALQLAKEHEVIQRYAASLEKEVAEHSRTEDALRQSEERTRLLLDSTAEAIYGVDTQGNCTFCNPACLRLIGYAEPADLLGKNMHALIHHRRADGTPYPVEQCRIYQAFQRGEGTHADDEVFCMADGKVIPVEYWSHPIRRGGQVVGAVVTFLDISDRRRLEEQFRQVQKMEAVGRLAGGVAHDFNNLVFVINGYSEIMMRRLKPDDPMRGFLKEIHDAGTRACGLTRQLLAFSRKQVLAPKILDLNSVVTGMEKMLRRLIGEDVALATALATDLGSVQADPGQIEQVIMNVAVNARDAMPQGGKLTIETQNAVLDDTYARNHSEVRPGPFILLAISDTGTGMSEEIKEHIFEPFYTTKGMQGTGLGLATVYGIIKQSGGHVAVYSEVGSGTTLKVYLPRLVGAAEVSVEPAETDLPSGTETVLLVEDEAAVRELVNQLLQMTGYTVLVADDAAKALEMAATHQGEIALVLTDVVMPQMSGRQLAEQTARFRPDMKVLYMSGYTDDAVVRHGVLDESMAFLQKPITPEALARKVREVLDNGKSKGARGEGRGVRGGTP